jgi:superfamily I DNA and/or RNA helicase
VRDLLRDETLKYSTNDIGVVASFRAQVLLIRTMLRSVGLGAIRVGSIDDYQGQEEEVVIVSTVFAGRRSKGKSKVDLGLLGNPRRFNVAVTRASSLLVVVGKSSSILHDPCWNDLIALCKKKGTFEVLGENGDDEGDNEGDNEGDDDDDAEKKSKGFPYILPKNRAIGYMPWRMMI